MARILVVDDEPIIAMTLADWIADLGHVALGPASDLTTALALAEDALEAAILDISLGVQTTASVAERLAARGVPFAVATGHDRGDIPAAFQTGTVLAKPFLFETFRSVVAKLLHTEEFRPMDGID